ncbi:hypothetical protein ASPTUDRAFT_425567 [Aspergillus tubingensis CBS 134.48]|uniref:Ubiquitin-like protease family profile domain-containing protein n=1 Tax=Aspergillus tubingensis (strain CBS 134.48) TaxID=767770 RepID=A0A1L9NFK3_ASPTC|nr:hypothetical protein ASPTUDRAFT_425567 [Aspergillus tubingensis CBS 134.48]
MGRPDHSDNLWWVSEAFLSLTVLLTPDGVDCIRGNIGGYPRLLLAIFPQRRLGTPRLIPQGGWDHPAQLVKTTWAEKRGQSGDCDCPVFALTRWFKLQDQLIAVGFSPLAAELPRMVRKRGSRSSFWGIRCAVCCVCIHWFWHLER